MAEYIGSEVEKWAARLSDAKTNDDFDEAFVYYKEFRKKLAQKPQLLGLMGYWKESFVKCLRNSHISPAYMEESIQILVTDFSADEVKGELTTYFEKINLPQQIELLDALRLYASEKFSDVISSFEEELANTTNPFKTFNQKREGL